MSSETTHGIQVTVTPEYLSNQSMPAQKRYVFAYKVQISNVGDLPAQLTTRHWVITHGSGRVEEVKGDGVVGETPRLEPGQAFEYTSGCVLETPRGTMHGSYQMVRDDGKPFDAVIPAFVMTAPGKAAERYLN